jgi:hypothetical protein
MAMATEVTTHKGTFWDTIYSELNQVGTPGWAQRLAKSRSIGSKNWASSVKEEEWKYTNVAPPTKLSFRQR